MKLKFKRQQYQENAAQSVVKCFEGQTNGFRRDLIGSTLYLAGVDTSNEYVKNPDCCVLCKRLIKNAGIEKVIIRVMPNVWETKYPENWDTPDVFYTKGEN